MQTVNRCCILWRLIWVYSVLTGLSIRFCTRFVKNMVAKGGGGGEGRGLFSLYIYIENLTIFVGLGGLVGCASDWRPGGCGLDPRRGRQHSFVDIDHEIFSTVIFSLPLIQEGQLSVSGERICTILVNRLED